MKKKLIYSLIVIVLASSFAVPYVANAQRAVSDCNECTEEEECAPTGTTREGFTTYACYPEGTSGSDTIIEGDQRVNNPNADPDFGLFNNFFKAISNMVLTLVGTILWMAGVLFNFSVEFSIIHFKGFVTDVGAIEIGWQVIRDLINMAFIFILLYIAISTILGMGKDMKKLIINIIIAALLINFSLFFTKVIIDASNIMALQFYEAIAPGASSSGGIGQALQEANSGISNQFMQAVKITTTFPSGGQVDAASILGNASLFTTSTFLGSIFIMILAFVFFAAAFLFIIRFVILILLMVVSPVAFVGMMLPQAKHISSRWWKTLLDQAFFAPVFLILIYLVLTIVSHPGFHALAGDGKFVEGFAGGNLAIVLNFFIVIALAIAALTISKGMMSGAAGKAVDWATKTGGALTFGAPGWAGRQTLGRAGRRVSESTWLNQQADKGGVFSSTLARGALYGGDKAYGSSFDARATSAGGAVSTFAGGGKGQGKGGLEKIEKDKIKERTERRKKQAERAAGAEKDKLESAEKNVAQTARNLGARDARTVSGHYENEVEAKKEKKKAKERVEKATKERDVALQSGDVEKIAKAEEKLTSANDALSKAEDKLKKASDGIDNLGEGARKYTKALEALSSAQKELKETQKFNKQYFANTGLDSTLRTNREVARALRKDKSEKDKLAEAVEEFTKKKGDESPKDDGEDGDEA